MDTQNILEYSITNLILFLYQIWQWLLDKIFSPNPPPPEAKLHRPKIAVVGAGLTGVSAASHCVGHGFDVQIFEAGDRKSLGGIWSVRSPSNPFAIEACNVLMTRTESEQHVWPPNS